MTGNTSLSWEKPSGAHELTYLGIAAGIDSQQSLNQKKEKQKEKVQTKETQLNDQGRTDTSKNLKRSLMTAVLIVFFI